MSMWYDEAGVLILKVTVSPRFTLIAVANPWMVESPAPLTCQSLAGSPARVFSQAITLVTGGPQGPAAAAGTAKAVGSAPIARSRSATVTMARTWLPEASPRVRAMRLGD